MRAAWLLLVGLLLLPAGRADTTVVVSAHTEGCARVDGFCFQPARIEMYPGQLEGRFRPGALGAHGLCIDTHEGVVCAPAAEPDADGQPLATLRARFAAPGDHAYWCPVEGHRARGMEGTLHVLAGETPAAPPDPDEPLRTADERETPGPSPAMLGLAGALAAAAARASRTRSRR